MAPPAYNTNPTPVKRQQNRNSRGFTLLEVLVVITIVAVLTGMVMVGFTGADQKQRQQGVAEQLAQRLQLARQRSIQRNKTWGLVVENNAYRFAEYDAVNESWLEQTERPFAPITLSVALEILVQVEGETLVAGAQAAEDEVQPDILFFASGEVTPFTLRLETEQRETAWRIKSDGLSSIQLSAGEVDL